MSEALVPAAATTWAVTDRGSGGAHVAAGDRRRGAGGGGEVPGVLRGPRRPSHLAPDTLTCYLVADNKLHGTR